MDELRAELETAQAERALLHRRVLESAAEENPPARRSAWGLAFTAAASVAAALGALLVLRPAPPPQVIVREVPVPVLAPETDAPQPEAIVPARVASPELVVGETATAEAASPNPPRSRRRATKRPRRPRRLGSMVDRCEGSDDPLCGLDVFE